MANPTDKQPCKAERRHIPAHVFATYDAMRACIGDEPKRVYFGGIYTLANLNNRNVQSERDNLEWLEREGWIICLNPDAQRRYHGKHDKDEYRVLWHDEWLAAQPGRECPLDKYIKVGDTWKLAKPGTLAPALWLGNLKATAAKAGVNLDALDPDDNLLALALLAAYRQEQAVAAIPATDTVTARPATAENTVAAIPATTVAAIPETAVAAIPATPVAAIPARSITPSGTTSTTSSPTIQPETPVGREEEALHSFAPSGAGDHEETEEAAYARYQAQEWKEFMKALPAVMQGAVFTGDKKQHVAKQLERYHKTIMLEAMEDWIAKRELPVEGRKFDKWGIWLDEGEPYLEKARAAFAIRGQVNALNSFRQFVPTMDGAFFSSPFAMPSDKVYCDKIAGQFFDDAVRPDWLHKWKEITDDISYRYQQVYARGLSPTDEDAVDAMAEAHNLRAKRKAGQTETAVAQPSAAATAAEQGVQMCIQQEQAARAARVAKFPKAEKGPVNETNAEDYLA